MGVERVHRLLRLIALLQSRRARTAAELMAELGVSRRTLFRDLNILQMAGVPYMHAPGEGYRLARADFLPPVSLTVPETLGLMLLAKQAAAHRNRPLIGPALSAIYKLLSSIPEPVRAACAETIEGVSIDPGAQIAGDTEARHYATLHRCVDEGRACLLRYHSPIEAEAMETLLHPYALHFAARAWYVLGWTAAHREVRVFKLARITALEPTDQLFEKPAGFTASAKLGNAWLLIPEGREYRVVLEFTPKVATNVSEVRWHRTQEHEILTDGRCRMTFTVDGIGEIAWWVCGYADQVEVIEPPELRERVKTMLRAALERYGA